MKSTHNIYHFHEGTNAIVDIDAHSYDEARKAYKELRGHFPKDDQRVESEPVR